MATGNLKKFRQGREDSTRTQQAKRNSKAKKNQSQWKKAEEKENAS